MLDTPRRADLLRPARHLDVRGDPRLAAAPNRPPAAPGGGTREAPR